MKRLNDVVSEAVFNEDSLVRIYNNNWGLFSDTRLVKVSDDIYIACGSFFRKGSDIVYNFLTNPEWSASACLVLNNKPTSICEFFTLYNFSMYNNKLKPVVGCSCNCDITYHNHDIYSQILKHVKDNDYIVFLRDGVYCNPS